MDNSTKQNNPNPRAKASSISVLFIWWLRHLFWKNYKHGLVDEDMCDVLEDQKAETLADRLEENWNRDVKRSRKLGREPSFTRTVIKTFWLPYACYGVFTLLDNAVIRMAQPLLLGKVIEYFTTDDMTKKEVYIYSAAMLVTVLLKFMMYHHYVLRALTFGMKIRVSCSVLIYRKILRHSRYSLDQSTTGKVVNLMSNDVARFEQAFITMHWIWLSLVQVTIVTYYLWKIVGYSAFIGFAYIFMSTVPLQGFLGKLTMKLRKKTATRTDERMRLMNEIVSGVQVIKMYAWEKPFAHLVSLARKKEINTITKMAYLRGFYLSSIVFIERSSLFVTLLAYSLSGYTVKPSQVFVMAQFYNVLNLALAFSFPMAVSQTAECRVSLTRIQEFLLKEEGSPKPIEGITVTKPPPLGQMILSNAFAQWNSEGSVLKKISISIDPGSLCAIIGPVGCGKSSLLHILLEELPLTAGSWSVGGKVAYSSQEPWIFVGTVRQNILFGQSYNPDKYKEVVWVCGLSRDFQIFPYGDLTLVGEKGITLSGGQRARINLARAVYQEADIYLLDDPLSAVDTHVGRHIFDKCINRYLKNKTCILVTHQLQYLQDAGHIIVLNNGEVETQGTPAEVMSSCNTFAKLLSANDEQEKRMDITRRPSRISKVISSANERAATKKDLIAQDEHKEVLSTDSFSLATYREYFRAGAGPWLMGFLVILLLLGQISTSGADYWVTLWTNTEVSRLRPSNTTASSFTHEDFSRDVFLGVYGAVVCCCIFITIGRSMLFFKICMRSSRNLHDAMFETILGAAMRFFDTNPSGRILNRFSKDIGAMDELLPTAMLMMVQIFLVLCGILVMVILMNYYIIVPLIFVGCIFAWLSREFVSACRTTKRIEAIRRSPVFSHLSDTLNGLTTIRTSGKVDAISKEFDNYQDQYTSASYLVIAFNVALGLWLDLLSFVFICSVTISFVVLGKNIFLGANVGLAISQSLILTGMLQYGIQQLTEVVGQIISVERVLEYTKIESEPALQSEPDKKPPDSWPAKGEVQFQHVFLRYSEKDDPVLKDVHITIEQKNKVGVVGRTGAGKSSLITTLFRLARVDGKIIIDNVDTALIGLHDLRKRISIIPQEPVLFSASMRYNLDPFNEFQDDVLWSALEEVELKAAVSSLDWKLSEGGGNLSVGQRQLVCLARAILRDSRVLVLDEATANVDPETDTLIQKTIRNKFRECTVITIAHRLNTIMDSDKVLVMDAGVVAEFDHPHILLQNNNGRFTKLVKETSKGMADKLRQIAEEAYRAKYKLEELPTLEHEVTRF